MIERSMKGFTRHMPVRGYGLAAIAVWPGLPWGSLPRQAPVLRSV